MQLNVGKYQDDIVLADFFFELSRYTGDNNIIVTVYWVVKGASNMIEVMFLQFYSG